MNPKLQAWVAHLVHSKTANQRPTCYDLIKFAFEKEAEINFDEAKKTRDSTLKPKAMTHFHFSSKKSMLPTTPAVQMVAPTPEEESGEGEATPLLSEVSDSGESNEATQDDTTISQGNVEIAVRVAQASETFTGRCFRCNKVRHWFHDEECEMYDPEFLNTSQGPSKTSKGNLLRAASLKLNERKEIKVGGKEEVWAYKAHAFPFPRDCPNPSPTGLSARKKHDVVPPQLLNADPLAQIIGMEP